VPNRSVAALTPSGASAAGKLGELHDEHAYAASGAADQDAVTGPQVDRCQSGGRRAPGHRKRARHLVADALRRRRERLGRRLHHHKVGDGTPQRASVDPLAHDKTRGAAADLIDNAGKVVAEAGRHGVTELLRHLGHRGDQPIHGIQTGGRDADAELARAGVRLRDLA